MLRAADERILELPADEAGSAAKKIPRPAMGAGVGVLPAMIVRVGYHVVQADELRYEERPIEFNARLILAGGRTSP